MQRDEGRRDKRGDDDYEGRRSQYRVRREWNKECRVCARELARRRESSERTQTARERCVPCVCDVRDVN